MTFFAFHADDLTVRSADDYLGSPMYSVIQEHQIAVVAVVLLLVATWVIHRRQRGENTRIGKILTRYERLNTEQRFLYWMVLLAGTIHIGLIPGHEPSGWTVAYGAAGAAQLFLASKVLNQNVRRKWALLVMLGSILGYAFTGLAGTVPDQVGIATKLIELTAVAVLIQPNSPGRLRSLGSATAVVILSLTVGVGAWVGAFAGDGGHHVGESAGPGTLIPRGEDRDPDQHEIEAADRLHQSTVAGVIRYADPAVAKADGYQVDHIVGMDYHAPNPAYQADGRILDPQRPENLIYAAGPDGPVLVGVMYEMEKMGEPGPAVGGPLTVWHGHDHICFSLLPPALAGLTSPFGVCPPGSLTMPITGEMLHVWTLPDAPDRFGHLEEDWLAAYLNGDPLPEVETYRP